MFSSVPEYESMTDLKPSLRACVKTDSIEGSEPQQWLPKFRQWPRVGLALMALLAVALIQNSQLSRGVKASIQEIGSHGSHSSKGRVWNQVRFPFGRLEVLALVKVNISTRFKATKILSGSDATKYMIVPGLM